jgi:tRNA A-37 threonylcarbamoyl transferase component Bud32
LPQGLFRAEPGGNLLGYEVGQRVADYEIVSLLGVGGMGRVYRVRNVISHRTEAMKVLLADLKAEPDLAARFVSEIRTLAGLDHPNIAQLHTALQAGNELVMMMEFVDGLTLQQLAQQDALPATQVVDYMHQVLSALSFAHSQGVVHRDIKPANIMVTPQGMVKLTDFGIAKSKIEHSLTHPGATVGSLNYMSPEQAQGGCAVDGRSDLYSVGITMYELLAGNRPFDDESAYVILHSQLNVAPRPPIELNPRLPRPLSDLILKALEKDPAKRFQSAAAFSEELSQVTGIAASTPMERGADFAPPTAAVPVARARARRASAVAATSRFSTVYRRRSWIAGEAVAVLGVLAFSVFGHPRFVNAGATAISFGHSAASAPSFAAAAHDVMVVSRSGKTGAEIAAFPNLIPYSAARSSAVVSPELRTRVMAGSTGKRGRTSAPKLTSVAYQRATIVDDSAPKMEAPAAPALTASTLAELQEIRRRRAELDARAVVIRISVQRLKSQREAAGDGLSQDVASAYVRMNAYLGAEKADLEEGDVTAARDHFDKAAFEVNLLEKLFSN